MKRYRDIEACSYFKTSIYRDMSRHVDSRSRFLKSRERSPTKTVVSRGEFDAVGQFSIYTFVRHSGHLNNPETMRRCYGGTAPKL